jgi:hypothetical protein
MRGLATGKQEERRQENANDASPITHFQHIDGVGDANVTNVSHGTVYWIPRTPDRLIQVFFPVPF